MAEETQSLTSSPSTYEMLRVAGDMLDVGVLTVDRDLRILTWNGWLETASGMQTTEVVGKPLSTLRENILPAAGEAAFRRALEGGTVLHSHRLHTCLLHFPPPAGHAFAHMQQSARIAPLLGPDGEVAAAVAFIEDVTERVAAEDELRAASKAAKAANQAKSDFLAAMSHELRTPIGAISGYADLLMDEIFGPVSTPQREHLARIKSVGVHLLRIVDEILTFARLEARREVPAIDTVDARLVVHEAAAAVEPLAGKKRLELLVRCPDKPVMMNTDETKLRQILINLLGNAVKFTARGSVVIELAATSDDTHATITVRDTGPGINPQDLERIFEPFVQSQSSFSRTHEGTGLGLSVSRQLARLLGGEITVSSVLGSGSTFVVSLPLDQAGVPTGSRISLEVPQEALAAH